MAKARKMLREDQKKKKSSRFPSHAQVLFYSSMGQTKQDVGIAPLSFRHPTALCPMMRLLHAVPLSPSKVSCTVPRQPALTDGF